MKKRKEYESESQYLWNTIRSWQKREGITDLQLASMLGLNVRTIKEYDKSVKALTLGSLDNFFERCGCTVRMIFLR